MKLEILYEDKDALVINKPAGISVHPSEQEMLIRAGGDARPNTESGRGKTNEQTLTDFILEKYPELETVGEPIALSNVTSQMSNVISRPGIVHRLDKETSGALLIAKNQEAYEFFKKQFKGREIEKIYHAFVYGWPKEDVFSVDLPIGRSTGDIRKWGTGKNTRGVMRDALTQFKVLSRFSVDPNSTQILNLKSEDSLKKGSTENGTYSFVEVRPKTGRTHQIRVHLKSVNHPVVADSLYAPSRFGKGEDLGFDRLALHARTLSFTLPNGEKKTIEAPYPKDFENAVKTLDL